jgi:hypothetical protein
MRHELHLVVLLTLAGAHGFRLTPALIVGLSVVCLLLLSAWGYMARQHPDAAAAKATGPPSTVGANLQSGVVMPFNQ